jgi:hypothetical protein
MRPTMSRVVIVAMTFALVGIFNVAPASAHEDRTIGSKHWHVAVGWGTEPAFAGNPNRVQLFLNDAKDKPVTDLGDTLNVDVTFQGQKTSLTFEPKFEVGEFGTEGDYGADIIPTRPGTYSFRLTGTIKGDRIDATFTCSEKTFDCVKDPAEQEFPAKDPNNSQLRSRIDRESARLAARAKVAKDDASTATMLGYIGIGVGAVALIVAAVRRRASKAQS